MDHPDVTVSAFMDHFIGLKGLSDFSDCVLLFSVRLEEFKLTTNFA